MIRNTSENRQHSHEHVTTDRIWTTNQLTAGTVHDIPLPYHFPFRKVYMIPIWSVNATTDGRGTVIFRTQWLRNFQVVQEDNWSYMHGANVYSAPKGAGFGPPRGVAAGGSATPAGSGGRDALTFVDATLRQPTWISPIYYTVNADMFRLIIDDVLTAAGTFTFGLRLCSQIFASA